MSSNITVCDALILSTVACSTHMSAVSAMWWAVWRASVATGRAKVASPAGDCPASCELGASASLWSFSCAWSSSRRYLMRVFFCKKEGKGEGGDRSAHPPPQIGKHAGHAHQSRKTHLLTFSPSAPPMNPFQEPWFWGQHEAILCSTAPKTVC